MAKKKVVADTSASALDIAETIDAAVDKTTARDRADKAWVKHRDVGAYRDGDTEVFLSDQAYRTLAVAEKIKNELAEVGHQVTPDATGEIPVCVINTNNGEAYRAPEGFMSRRTEGVLTIGRASTQPLTRDPSKDDQIHRFSI